MSEPLAALEARLDAVSTALLVPLRADKSLSEAALRDLAKVGADLAALLAGVQLVPVALVGKCWFVSTVLLSEADHARQPDPILDAAWSWQEQLRQAFGPHFD